MIANIEPVAGKAVTIETIQDGCERLARVRARAERLMLAVEKKRQAILDENAETLNQIAQELAAARAELNARVESARALFRKPKTQVFHAIEVGFGKERDKLIMPENDVLIPRIEQMLKPRAMTLIRVEKSVVMEAFKQLSTADKQMLGCRVQTGADKVVIRPQSPNDVEKYFAACQASAEVAS